MNGCGSYRFGRHGLDNMKKEFCDMSNQKRKQPDKPDPNLIKTPPETLFAILVALVLVPLLLTGFISQ